MLTRSMVEIWSVVAMLRYSGWRAPLQVVLDDDGVALVRALGAANGSSLVVLAFANVADAVLFPELGEQRLASGRAAVGGGLASLACEHLVRVDEHLRRLNSHEHEAAMHLFEVLLALFHNLFRLVHASKRRERRSDSLVLEELGQHAERRTSAHSEAVSTASGELARIVA